MKPQTLMNQMYRRVLKRALDVVVSLVLLILFSPVMLLITFLQLFFHKGKVLFKQQRPGYREKLFYILKFKTMSDAVDEGGNLLPDVKRLTAWGSFLRKSSLDELPQLINILKGDMSLVGPRPLLVEYLSRYSERQKMRHWTRPGVTGWAQVNGRNAISWDQKFELDVWYVEHLSFWLDLRILLKTVRKVITAEKISHQGHATMPNFKGNNIEYEEN